MSRSGLIAALSMAAVALLSSAISAQTPSQPAGVVSNIKVLTDKWPDVSSLEDWKKSCIKEGMTDKDKALAIFNTEVAYQMTEGVPKEYLQRDKDVVDPIKLFNVYGATWCSVSAANVMCLARYCGMPARGRTINNHCIMEIFYDKAWHMFDADLVEYYPKADGTIASLQEIVEGVQAWLKEHPDFPVQRQDQKQARYKWMKHHNWKTEGPDILSRGAFYDAQGWLPDGNWAWGDTIFQFSKINNTYECCYSMGYRVNVQLRAGERLTRNWSNKGLCLAALDGGKPWKSLDWEVGKAALRHLPKWGDLAPGRIGNGTLQYEVPLASGEFRRGALAAENLAAQAEDQQTPAVHVKDPAAPAVLDIRMPSSYVYLGGSAALKAVIGEGGEIKVRLSDNNGLDWKDVATIDKTGDRTLDLNALIGRRYCYAVRFEMKGKGTGLDALKISNDFEHSQRPLPCLVQGENKINFTAGAQEGTITIEGALGQGLKFDKQLTYADFHPTVEGIELGASPKADGKPISLAFPVKTPGDMTRLRVSDHFSSMAADTQFVIDVSFDDGKTWKTVDTPTAADFAGKPRFFIGRYCIVTDIPAGTRAALVRYRGSGKGTLALNNARIDADYKEPAGGFRPVQVTYVWTEDGVEKRDVHVATSPEESYTIKCDAAPLMKSLILELAK